MATGQGQDRLERRCQRRNRPAGEQRVGDHIQAAVAAGVTYAVGDMLNIRVQVLGSFADHDAGQGLEGGHGGAGRLAAQRHRHHGRTAGVRLSGLVGLPLQFGHQRAEHT